MTQDKEKKVRLQFLTEAQDYLNTLESGLLGLGTHGINRQEIDHLLRAAHSIKGGAAMMGFQTLSNIAHRLEDFFKVLKAGKNDNLDEQLEGLFLSSVDRLRQIAQWNRQDIDIETTWLEKEVNPLIDALYQRLGDPQAEDAVNLLSEEAEEDMVVIMFESEVESCLRRLESVFADPQQPCLREEFLIAAQELEGLGQMLELPPFSALCQSIVEGIETYPQDMPTIANLALQAWRRSHAMVMVGQRTMIPTEIDLSSLRVAELSETWEDEFHELDDSPLSFGIPSNTDSSSSLTEGLILFSDMSLEVGAASELEEQGETPEIIMTPETLKSYLTTQDFTQEAQDFLANLNDVTPQTPEDLIITSSSTDTGEDNQPDTIRVPVEQLEILSDRFGELTIERNGLNLQVKRLRHLIELLSDRVQTLEQSNQRLRNNYDQITPRIQSKESVYTALRGNGLRKNFTSNLVEGKQGEINALLETFDSLEMDRYSDAHLVSQEIMDTVVQLQEVTNDLQLNLEETESSSRAFSRTSQLMQNTITQLRMRPISDVVGRFRRGLRAMEVQYGKQVNFKIKGGATLLDRTVLEALNDPLLHLLRNAFDHGIESPEIRQTMGKPPTGTISITAGYRGNKTIITLQDDGAGIDIEKIRLKALEMGLQEADLQQASDQDLLDLIFEPGFSTAAKVTDLSGRGVGMDVVRTNLRQIQGDIHVNTQPNKGTTFTITVPFTLSVVRVLLVESAGMLLAFPHTVIEEIVPLHPEMFVTGGGQEMIHWDGSLVPLIRLKQWFDFPRSPQMISTDVTPIINQPTVLMISHGNHYVAIEIDRYWGEQEVAIRQVEGNFGLPKGFGGCTILGDGRVVPLVDVMALLQWLNDDPTQSSFTPKLSLTMNDLDAQFIDHQAKTIMIVEDSINVRRFLALTLEKAGYRVEQAKDGQDALEKLQDGLAATVKLVISDIEMPRLDGYGLLSHLKSNLTFQQLPVIMLTSRSGDKHRQLAMNLGASAYFSKPFKETNLLTTIQQLIKP
ncbi:hybrid sensor histidine kinase/response regulator [Crocosphaera chwakensis]|uniref:histidine kinase n=1 Tax=Crocosphaera chwakensis CCY0110 TaxID=391612 RepID=A3IM09_9CHRO|nr:hybrid sensor histidine kinase/response regulator [Crocosphaera chwakensis]EAZ92465.1 CheA signal transduction histidine kinase [Crocosphaera chwakensis CCY0110]